ncbi:EamA family transporter [Pantoea stewartii]
MGLLRSVSEAFGPTGGAALIYSITALLLCLTRGLPDPRVLPRRYLLALAAALAWALYNNVTRRYACGSNGVSLFFIVTALVLWLKFAFGTQQEAMHVSAAALAQVLFVGASTAVAYSAWNDGIQQGNLPLLATASCFTPVLSALLASLWLGLTPPASFWQGVALITAGSLIGWRATYRL